MRLRLFYFFAHFALITAVSPVRAQEVKIGLPIVYIHQACTDGQICNEPLANVRDGLNISYPELYTNLNVYLASCDGTLVNFKLAAGEIITSIPGNSRFFEIAIDAAPESSESSGVAFTTYDYSYQAADELARIVWRIKQLTLAPSVIIVADSVGDSAARAYMQGYARTLSSTVADSYDNDLAAVMTTSADIVSELKSASGAGSGFSLGDLPSNVGDGSPHTLPLVTSIQAFTISSQAVTVAANSAALFSARSNSTGVESGPFAYSVLEGQPGGTITAEGSYSAPSVAGTYHIVAVDRSDSSRYGMTAVTVSDNVAVPSATTLPATNITSSGASLGGSVLSGNTAGSAYFQWGTDPSHLSGLTPPVSISQGSKTTIVASLTDLASNSAIFYEAVFVGSDGTQELGAISTFETLNFSAITGPAPAAFVTVDGACFEGRVNSGKSAAEAFFAWGTSSSDLNNSTTPISISPTIREVHVSGCASGPPSGTRIYYQAVLQNLGNGESTVGTISSVSTLPLVARTSLALAIKSSTALIAGSTAPFGGEFLYGTNPSNLTNVAIPTGGHEVDSVFFLSANLTGLLSNTTYFYQMVINGGSAGSAAGTINSFTTLPFFVTTGKRAVLPSGILLNGSVNSNGSTGNAFFIWGTSPSSLSNETSPVSITTSLSKQSVDAILSGLSPNTTYFYQLVFQNTSNGQIGDGTVESFFTGCIAPR